MYHDDKAEFSSWWFLVLGLVLVSAVAFATLRFVGTFGSTVVERKVFEESYQRSESYKERIALLEASKAELQARLQQPNLNDNTKAEIQTQLVAVNAQLRAARSQQ